MPAKAKLFDAKAETIFDFGAASRNTALFNPQGTGAGSRAANAFSAGKLT